MLPTVKVASSKPHDEAAEAAPAASKTREWRKRIVLLFLQLSAGGFLREKFQRERQDTLRRRYVVAAGRSFVSAEEYGVKSSKLQKLGSN